MQMQMQMQMHYPPRLRTPQRGVLASDVRLSFFAADVPACTSRGYAPLLDDFDQKGET
jgi:hypothetical protein